MMLVTKKNQFFHFLELKDLEQDLLQFYAKCFTNDNFDEAKRIIKFDHSDQIRKKDLKVISATSGALIVLVPQILYIFFSQETRKLARIVNPEQADKGYLFADANRVFIGYEINRFCMICAMIVLLSGGVVHVLRRYKINYIHIFAIQPYFQLTHFQLYNLGLILTVLFVGCLLMQECSDMFNLEPDSKIYEPSFICFVTFLAFLVNPMNRF